MDHDLAVDVLVVGGGMAGIACAYRLGEAGYRVALLERDEVGSAASGASSGVLYHGSGLNFEPSSRLFGEERAQQLWQETADSIEELAHIAEQYSISCGLRRCGAIMVAKYRAELETLELEKAGLDRAGISSKLLASDEVRSYFPLREFLGGLSFDDCAQIHPALLASGLAKATGLAVHENSPMTSYKESGDGAVIRTPQAQITCRKLIIATNHQPFLGLESHFELESSVILASQPQENLEAIWPAEKIIWTMEEKYDVLYPRESRAILELYQLGDEEAKLSYYYPGVDFRIDRQWGDVWARTSDWLPIVGKMTPSIAVATAMGDQGIVMSWTSAKHIAKAIEGETDWFLEMTSPDRFKKTPARQMQSQ